ncbi:MULTISPECIES: 3-isopropylmalate dehydrogenase [Dehalobacter]|jgi:3-isopropylmalate dehydrogenase|uniref:3-isopropylmalate dehydrogenase n=2 Tax=Dehalobacter restrictus TaxID=55583 RepID=A0A857DKW9_9FIRM|nr:MULTISPECIES: 3-isopropylmalate dehydrogenase [Dehalobacter]AHF10186.1 3-isopropylmalate dehydrogenase [Dehalobacter restrictus DSM 9455]MCG1024234.1 3-isopropylmalate dehydrogenase [Dehalobacter sp.]MDJ0307163.1 3-isopropylmalate dehydrogenase [Dehalobacter sp.]OCZ50465.1 3-isopropylmalate dehydrogenase [Dehalobacter sp. TeCB1]QHA00776.1 3-isopropylmalate dehydrogenase [Dehalobacter restrictus]
MPKIAVLPGDGIGREIIPEALKVLQAALEDCPVKFEFDRYLIGGAAIDEVGKALPAETLDACKKADAVLLGAIGGPKWDTLPAKERPELGALLPIRKELGLYANIRPVKMIPSLISASTLREEVVKNVDMVVIRELTGGIYFGEKGRNENPKAAYDVLLYHEDEIRRIIELGFETARGRRKKLCSVDKANVLESSRFWREIAEEVAKEYPDVELMHMYVDNAAMQLVRYPEQFDVIVTENMFGDILTDLASMLGGSIGMLASASLSGKKGLYEPAHGSAPDIAGQNKANPLATILSAAMMLRYTFDLNEEADRIEQAVAKVLDQGCRTADLAKPGDKVLGTKEMGDAVVAAL